MIPVCVVLAWPAVARAEQRVPPDDDFRIAIEDARFGPALRRPLRVVRARTGEPLADDLRCRWIPAHADVGLAVVSPDGCAAEVYVDPRRTRHSRFELDPWMGVDVIVRRGGRRVGFASTRLRFVE